MLPPSQLLIFPLILPFQNDSESSAGGGGMLAAIKSGFKKGKRSSVDGMKEESKHVDKGPVAPSPPSETDTDADDESRRAGKVVPIIAPPGMRTAGGCPSSLPRQVRGTGRQYKTYPGELASLPYTGVSGAS